MSECTSMISARAYVADWLFKNKDRLSIMQQKIETAESPAKILSAWYETSSYLIDVSVWEHTFCLDILVLDQRSGETVFVEAGSCENVSGLEERLSIFADWLLERSSE